MDKRSISFSPNSEKQWIKLPQNQTTIHLASKCQQMKTTSQLANKCQQIKTALRRYDKYQQNQNFPSLSRQMPTNQNYSPLAPPKSPWHYGAQHQSAQPNHQQQYAQPGQQMPSPIHQKQYAQPVQQMPSPIHQQQYAQPGQQMPSPIHQKQYAQPCQQMPSPNYQQQLPPQPMQYQYYQQNNGPNYQQQMPPQPMLYQQQLPPVVAPPFQVMPLQLWSSTLFDCMQDPENYLITALCPCVTFGQIAEITDHGMTTCATSGLIYVLLMYFTGLHCLYSCMYRQKLRAQYSLVEDLPDILIHAFLEPCSLCQMARELKNRGFNLEIGWAQNMQMQGQVVAAPGVYVPPPVQTMGK